MIFLSQKHVIKSEEKHTEKTVETKGQTGEILSNAERWRLNRDKPCFPGCNLRLTVIKRDNCIWAIKAFLYICSKKSV